MFDSPHPRVVFERLLNSEQAAAIIKVHPKTLQRYARTGIVTGLRVGKLWRFRASDLLSPLTADGDGNEDGLDDNAGALYADNSYPCRLKP